MTYLWRLQFGKFWHNPYGHGTNPTIKIMNIFPIPPNLLMSLCNPSLLFLLPIPRQPMICFLSTLNSWHLLEFYINGILKYVLFFCLHPFTQRKYVRVSHSVVCISSSFLFITEYYFFMWIYHNLFPVTQWQTSGLFPVGGYCK